MSNKKLYVIMIWGDVEPKVFGPYNTAHERDRKALALKEEHGDNNGIFRAEVGDYLLSVRAYPHHFFNPEDTQCRICGNMHTPKGEELCRRCNILSQSIEHNPEVAIKILESIPESGIADMKEACQAVIDRWEEGDLAEAARQCQDALNRLNLKE